jgi:hypothetical protein
MSIIEQGGARGGGIVRWVGYGLSLIGLILPFVPARFGGPALAAATLVLPALIFALLLYAPEAFGQTLRGTRTRTVSLVLILPPFILFATALGAGVLDTHYALLPAGVCAAIAVLLGLGAAARPMPGSLVAAIIFLALYGAGYGFGGLVYADVRFDRDPGQLFPARVLGHDVTHGRGGPSYRLMLEPFGPVTRPVGAAVSSETYARLNPGDTACATLHPGALRMAWYRVGLCPPS